VTTALAHVVASGAVEALALIGTPSAHDELRTLLAEIRRRDLLKRIAAVVGEAPAETATRDDRVRREKARAVGATSDPEPRERQREASAAVRRELAPRLAEAGFDDSAGRTFWRALDDRIEVVHVRAHAGGLTLELGIWFRDVPRKTEPVQRAGRLRPSEFACDLRGSVHAWSHELAAAYERSETWFGRFRPLATVIELLLGGRESESAHGFGAPGSPVRALVVGYLARSIGDAETAQPHLDRAAGFFRDQLERYRVDRPAEVTSDWEAWVERLEADAAG
jgi:hypothetical protein